MTFSQLATSRVMLLLSACLCFTAPCVFAQGSPQQGSPPRDPVGFLIRMERSQAELIPHGTTGGLCAVIWPDGKLHAVRRRQTLPSTHAAIQVYDSILSAEQMAVLTQLLDSEKVLQVPPFATPHLPLQVAAYYMFTADIRRPEGVQHVGFLQFGQNGGNGDNPLVVEDARTSDTESRAALQPLLEWIQSTVDQSDANPGGKVNFCESPQN